MIILSRKQTELTIGEKVKPVSAGVGKTSKKQDILVIRKTCVFVIQLKISNKSKNHFKSSLTATALQIASKKYFVV